MPDIPGGPSTTTVLTVGGSVSNQIEVGGDSDWIRITLTEGELYQFTLDGTGADPLGDPYLTLRDAAGNIVAFNDDGGPGLNSLLGYAAQSSGTYYLDVQGYDTSYTGGYTLSASIAEPLPEYTVPQIAAYLTDGYWNDTGRDRHAFAGSTISYDISALTADGQALAIAAFETWSAVSGLSFVAATGDAQITFDDEDSGAYASYEATGGTTTSAFVNVSTDWLADYGTEINSYSFQTYIHEIGHALGLGHAGAYNGSGGWSPVPGGDNHFLNDSWQATVMSYFDQDENTSVDASYAFIIGPMLADIYAIQDLYGVPSNVNAGTTTYGFNSTATGYFDFSQFIENDLIAFTIYDSGGADTLDASGFVGAQTIDLRAGAYSDIGGEDGNIGIALNTVIENAIGGQGADLIYGNDGANTLDGGEGADTLNGLGGNDTLRGNGDNDIYVVDTAGDLVFEANGQGTDTVLTTVSYTLAAGQSIETLRLGPTASTAALNLNGNEFAQTLLGNNGANTLDGRGGADILRGFGGNDVYVVDTIADQVFEANGQGTDTVLTTVSYTLAAGQSVETLRLGPTASTAALNLAGNAFAQTLLGNNGANILDGRGGADSLRGFGGNDAYFVDTAGDLVFEANGQGTDTVLTTVSYTLAAGQSIETLRLGPAASTAALNLNGNEFAQTLLGNNGSNILDGRGGADTLRGFGGNDSYVVDTNADQVFEANSQGTDTVLATVSYKLAAGQSVETLRLAPQGGTAALFLIGNEFGQTLLGNNGNNILDGGAGNDILGGLAGNDSFQFSTALGAGNIDRIADFSVPNDTIRLDRTVFSTLALGTLSANAYKDIGDPGAVVDADDRILYNDDTGQLFYDTNGSAAGGRLQFAILDTKPATLTNADFFVVA